MDTADQALIRTQASKRARRLRTNDEKRRIVEEATVPGASVAAVARKHGVNANLVFGWLRLHKSGLLEQCREPAALVPVKIETPTLLPDRASRELAVPKVERAVARSRSSRGHVEVSLPGGITVRVHGRVEREALVGILAALRAR